MIEPDKTPIDASYVNGCFFNVDSTDYSLRLRYEGPIPEVGKTRQDEVYRYAFGRVDLTGGCLETGKLRWDPINGPMTYREAQKALITYWRTKTTPVDPDDLDKIVLKCAFWMHAYFLSENEENTDYDIVRQYMDEEEWSVVLRPNYMENRLVEFHQRAGAEIIDIHSYTEDNELGVKF